MTNLLVAIKQTPSFTDEPVSWQIHMEPMKLGSPPSPGVKPNFLPSFLIGDTQPSTPSQTISPSLSQTPTAWLRTSSDSRNIRHKLFNQSTNDAGLSQLTYRKSTPIDKLKPPKQGLFDTLESSNKMTVLNSTRNQQEHSADFSRIASESLNISDISRNLNESTGGTGSSMPAADQSSRGKSSSLWVTAFGFPPSATSLILAQLANCGCIVEKNFPTQGNWIHIKYSMPHEVENALSLNGKLVSNNIMLGVVPYVNKMDGRETVRGLNVTSPPRVRSLRQTYVSPSPTNATVQQNVPQKSTGVVTKAIEYMFGWWRYVL